MHQNIINQPQSAMLKGEEKRTIKGVKRIILIASGKGGVGKSTITVQLAAALKEKERVGIIDADIYGPSIPHLLGNDQKPEIDQDNQMVPLEAYGIRYLSIGNLVAKEKAAIWRGPMVIKALYQLFTGTNWQGVDTLLVDMPPGTGDIQLSIAKQFKLDGVILVSTPQPLALLDVKKYHTMCTMLNVPVLGMIENMAYIELPNSSERHYPFGTGEVEIFAKEHNIPILATLPIDEMMNQNPLSPRKEIISISL